MWGCRLKRKWTRQKSTTPQLIPLMDKYSINVVRDYINPFNKTFSSILEKSLILWKVRNLQFRRTTYICYFIKKQDGSILGSDGMTKPDCSLYLWLPCILYELNEVSNEIAEIINVHPRQETFIFMPFIPLLRRMQILCIHSWGWKGTFKLKKIDDIVLLQAKSFGEGLNSKRCRTIELIM